MKDLSLLAAHAVGDWIVQTDWQAANKTESWKANQFHMATYHATLFVAMLGRPWRRVLGALVLSWAVHSVVDRRWPVRELLARTGSESFSKTPLGILAADQALHLATLAVVSEVLG